ncbi:hypothetical protein [Streptomyces sp. NPDC005012]|uniref:hypothetical protein n=1 Tax=Streptomyces sp. NPDC005012 TaxID=3154558 RepID=UPI0033A6F467
MVRSARQAAHGARPVDPPRDARPGGPGAEAAAHNLFDAAAAYVAASATDDEEAMDEAASWVSPEALSFGVNELACRAVLTLSRERGVSPDVMARDLLGLPAARS